MSPFHHEGPSNPAKRCKFFVSTLKDAFSDCCTCRGRLPSSPHEEDPASDLDVEEEVFVSAIISKYKESKCKRKASNALDSFYLASSPATGDLFITEKAAFQECDNEQEEKEGFFEVESCLSECSTAASMETFVSVKTNFTHCSSLNKIDVPDIRRLSINQEVRHCEGWPFGLCQKALLIPPLPKSPSDSWSWHKATRKRLGNG